MLTLKNKNYLHTLTTNKISFIKKIKRKFRTRLFSQKIYPKLLNKKKRFLNYKHFSKRINQKYLNKKKFLLLNILIPIQKDKLNLKLKEKLLCEKLKV